MWDGAAQRSFRVLLAATRVPARKPLPPRRAKSELTWTSSSLSSALRALSCTRCSLKASELLCFSTASRSSSLSSEQRASSASFRQQTKIVKALVSRRVGRHPFHRSPKTALNLTPLTQSLSPPPAEGRCRGRLFPFVAIGCRGLRVARGSRKESCEQHAEHAALASRIA